MCGILNGHVTDVVCPVPPRMQGVEFWAVNTDAQALANHAALNKVQIGTELTRGLGCGGNPNLGQKAALESEEALKKMVQVSACQSMPCKHMVMMA